MCVLGSLIYVQTVSFLDVILIYLLYLFNYPMGWDLLFGSHI